MASLPLTRLGEVVMVAVVAAGESSRFRFALRPRRGIALLIGPGVNSSTRSIYVFVETALNVAVERAQRLHQVAVWPCRRHCHECQVTLGKQISFFQNSGSNFPYAQLMLFSFVIDCIIEYICT